jgi:hypothetical protein
MRTRHWLMKDEDLPKECCNSRRTVRLWRFADIVLTVPNVCFWA